MRACPLGREIQGSQREAAYALCVIVRERIMHAAVCGHILAH